MADSSEPAPENRYKSGLNEHDIMLVIATLIAAATFQAGVNPPGGIWQDDKDGHIAGRAIYAFRPIPFYVFMFANTSAFSTSLLVIIRLTPGLRLQWELRGATVLMMVTYVSAIFAVTPRELVRFRFVLIAAALPVIIWCISHLAWKPSGTQSQQTGRAPNNAKGKENQTGDASA